MSASHPILIPVDFSEPCLAAVKHSYSLAKAENCKIMLLNVQAKGAPSNGQVQAQLQKLVEQIKSESGVEAEYKIVPGNKVANLILKVAKEIEPRYIIIGLDKKGDSNEFIGSMTFRVISRSNAPVLCINKDRDMKFKKIVMPIDLSKSSRQKLPKVLHIAQLTDAEVDILLVLEENHPLNKQKLILYGNQVADMLSKKKVKNVTHFVTGGKYHRMITKHADKVGADLLVIMTQAEYTYMELFVDKTAMHIINDTTIPVLSLRPLKIEGRTYF
ncbi:MAG: universal stress protein [Crocinitomicaceae bacterium]|nr:universal stress protein [Crocinitomicaceae bacterium]